MTGVSIVRDLAAALHGEAYSCRPPRWGDLNCGAGSDILITYIFHTLSEVVVSGYFSQWQNFMNKSLLMGLNFNLTHHKSRKTQRGLKVRARIKGKGAKLKITYHKLRKNPARVITPLLAPWSWLPHHRGLQPNVSQYSV